jgi:hypothetical protein
LYKPYVAIGELVSDQLTIKILPGYIKNQVKQYGELVLFTLEDMTLDATKGMGIKTPGWWYINKYVSKGITRYRNELLVAVNLNDEIVPVMEPIKPIEIVPVMEPIKPVKSTKSDVNVSTKK